MLVQVPLCTGTGTGMGTSASITPQQPCSPRGALANPPAPPVPTQHLRSGCGLSPMGCRHSAGTCPARCTSLSVLLSPVDKPFQTSSLRLRRHFSPGLSTSQQEAQKGIKHCKAPRINAAGDPPAQRCPPHHPALSFSSSHLLQKHTDAAKSLLAVTKKGVKMSNCTCVRRGLEQWLWISNNPAPPHPGTLGVHFHGATGLLQYK